MYHSNGLVTAQSLDQGEALVLWTYSGCTADGHLVSAVAGRMAVPLPQGGKKVLTGVKPGHVVQLKDYSYRCAGVYR